MWREGWRTAKFTAQNRFEDSMRVLVVSRGFDGVTYGSSERQPCYVLPGTWKKNIHSYGRVGAL